MIPRPVRGAVLSSVVFANNKAKLLAIRLTRWTGKSREYVHPKHLLGESEENYWYLGYVAPDAEVLDLAGLCSYSDPDHKIEYTLEELQAELARNGFRIVHLHPTVYDTPLIGVIDLVGGISLGLYRRLTEARRRLARRYPEENAGFFAVCEAK